MRRTTVLITAAAAATAGVAITRRHRRMAEVAPELRHPQLYVPLSLRGDTSLRIGRRMLERMPAGPIDERVSVRTEHVPASGDRPSARVLVYAPDGRSVPSGALVWFHGGGFVMGAPEFGHELCSRIAADLGIVVVSADYRLAPEHPFPAGLEDCYAALTWTHEQAGQLGLHPDAIAVGGDSAGGGLAACVAQVALDRGGPPVCFQLLQYPMLDDRTALRADHDALVWTMTSNRYAWSAYLGHPVSEHEPRPYASAARRDDLHGLPRAWIGIGEIDLFHDECVEYAARLRAADVPCTLHAVHGMYHGAQLFAPDAPAAREFVDGMVAALGDALSTT